MVKGPLADRLEYGILEVIFQHPEEATHQADWEEWQAAVQRHVSESTRPDLLSAFKRLWKNGMIRLTKPNTERYHAADYSGAEADDRAFFFMGPFNGSITDDGRSHWDGIRREKPARPIGFGT